MTVSRPQVSEFIDLAQTTGGPSDAGAVDPMRHGSANSPWNALVSEPLINAYLNACYRIRRGADEHRLHIGTRCALPPAPAGSVQAVLSACNPGSRLLSDAANRVRRERLHLRLRRLSLSWLPALNCAADGSWPEPACWLPAVTPTLLDRLARTFGQYACVTVGSDRIIRLRLYRPEWQTLAQAQPQLLSAAGDAGAAT